MKHSARSFSYLFSVIFFLLFFSVFSFLFHLGSNAYAADNQSFGIANYLPISDTNVKDGDIVSFSPKGYFLSKTEYDAFAVGVVTFHPAISIEVKGDTTTYAVVSTGDTSINISLANGPIKKGDPITTSKIRGAGMKSTKFGYIIGVALDNFSSTNKKEIKKIPVRLNLHYYITQSAVNSGFMDVFNLSALATYQEPLKAFQYVVAAVVVIISLLMSFFLFARTANKGIEALGRNPLASKTIQTGILLNVSIAITIVVAGLIIGFIVLRL